MPATDLLDFEGEALYFDEPLTADVEQLIVTACDEQDPSRAEMLLLRASVAAPHDLSVIVALYRSYYFRQRLEDALQQAERAMAVCAERLGFPADWRDVMPAQIAQGAARSMPTTRFYLWALKGAGYLLMRLGRVTEALVCLEKLCALDLHDRLGGVALALLARETLAAHAQPEEVRTDEKP